MNFIERFFNVSPDSGTGSLELACFFVIVAVLAAPVIVRRVASAIQRSDPAAQHWGR